MKQLSTRSMLSVLGAALALAACSVPGEARQGARVLAAYTSQVKAETERFAKTRTALAKARQRNMNALEDSAVVTEQANQRELFLWGFEKPAPGPGRQELYQGIVAAADASRKNLDDLATLRKEHEARVAKATARVQTRTAELAETAKALAQIGEKPDFQGRMKFYLCFFESVHRSIKETQQAGDDQAQAAVTAADAKNPGAPAAGAAGDAGTATESAPAADAPAETPAGNEPAGAGSSSACAQ
jgi:DNA repair exonuclease SbcCD ATPase subunit